jgi:TPR repeat protein
MYQHGQGVPQDYVSAHMWSNLAASRGMDTDTRDLAAENRYILAVKMTPAQIAEAQRLASEWASYGRKLVRA